MQTNTLSGIKGHGRRKRCELNQQPVRLGIYKQTW